MKHVDSNKFIKDQLYLQYFHFKDRTELHIFKCVNPKIIPGEIKTIETKVYLSIGINYESYNIVERCYNRLVVNTPNYRVDFYEITNDEFNEHALIEIL